jgi:putative transposase
VSAEIFAAVRRAHGIDTADLDAGMQKLLSVDSTTVRAHQHAAGARSDTLTGGTVE